MLTPSVHTYSKSRWSCPAYVRSDGLHLTPAGYEVAFEMLMKTVDSYYPELAAEALPRPVAA